MKKFIEQCLVGFILKGDNKGVKGLLIEVCADVGIVTNPLVSAIIIAIVKAIVKDIVKVIAKVIAVFSITTNTSAKAKGKVEVKKDAFIMEQFYVFLEVGILLFIIASALLIIFVQNRPNPLLYFCLRLTYLFIYIISLCKFTRFFSALFSTFFVIILARLFFFIIQYILLIL